MIENLRLSFQSIWAHKMRSMLTMLGIIIGIASIIAIVSTIQGTYEQNKESLIGGGTNNVTIKLMKNGEKYPISGSNSITYGVPVLSDSVKEQILALDTVASVTAYTERINQYESVYYKSMDPVGETLSVNGTVFTIIGVVTETETYTASISTVSDYKNRTEVSYGYLFLPDACWPLLYCFDEPQNVIVKAASTDDMEKAGSETIKILNDRISPNQTEVSYEAQDLAKQASLLEQLGSSSNTQMIWIASISLLVGGIGVMNVMMMTVTERTSEIGLKKAIGAKKRAILGQFLTESVVLTSLGGLLGVGAGIGISYFIHNLSGIPVAISIPASIIAVVFSMLIGILFGLFPSMKAANMDPIEALRRE
ncbi:MAG: ABC transporter permease [Lachnospiraceae bacterium]|nr:ABC transporter permease [Lachnospiraceae bacterium]